ncbi:MAG: OmpH family outer membrane protein [Verrucomicrobiales bacterium]|nr:OmpH family outer membrane protein [Verrucomicrobiales bacterium]
MKSVFFVLALVFAFHQVAFSEGGGVAILDIDAVARQLGIEEQVRVELAALQKRLAQDLQKTQAQLQTEMNGVQRAAGENPSEQQLRQIRATSQQLNSEFARLKTQAEQSLAQERVRMINEFRIKLEPIAKDAAAERGLDVVIMKVTPPVFTFSSNVDITEATYKLAVEAGMQVKPAATSAPGSKPEEGAAGEEGGEAPAESAGDPE